MSYRVLVHDRQGIPLTDLRCEEQREWVLGKMGHASLFPPITDFNIDPDNFAVGNRVIVWSENFRPWAGVVFVNKEWSDSRFLCEVYGPEVYFDHRVVLEAPPNGLDGGAMIRWLLQHANQQGQTPIVQIGTMQLGQSELENGTIGSGMYIMDAINSVLDVTYSEYYFEPMLDNGQTLWELNVTPRAKFPGEAMWHGANVAVDPGASPVMSGDLWTKLFVKAQLKSGDVVDVVLPSTTAPVEEFGVWWGSVSVKVISPKQAIALARTILRDQAVPKTTIKVKAFPSRDRDLTLSLRPGSTHRMVLEKRGFMESGIGGTGGLGVNTTLRALGVRYNESDGYAEVTMIDTATEALFDAWLQEILSVYQ